MRLLTDGRILCAKEWQSDCFDIIGSKNIGDLEFMVSSCVMTSVDIKNAAEHGQTSQVTAQHVQQARFLVKNRLMINSLKQGPLHN